MNTQHLSVYKVHEYVTGQPPSIEKFEDRILAQKVIYLADALGAYCGDYKWNWYKKGPYSPALARVLYQDYDANPYKSYSVREDVRECLEPLKKLIEKRPNNLSLVDWLELLASFFYLYKESISKNVTDVSKVLIDFKPKYSQKNALYAYNKLIEYGII